MFTLEGITKKISSGFGALAGYLVVPAYAAPCARAATSTALNIVKGPATGFFSSIGRQVAIEKAGSLAYNYSAAAGCTLGGLAGAAAAQVAITGGKYANHKYNEHKYIKGAEVEAKNHYHSAAKTIIASNIKTEIGDFTVCF